MAVVAPQRTARATANGDDIPVFRMAVGEIDRIGLDLTDLLLTGDSTPDDASWAASSGITQTNPSQSGNIIYTVVTAVSAGLHTLSVTADVAASARTIKRTFSILVVDTL